MKRFFVILLSVIAVILLLVIFTPLRYYNPILEGVRGLSDNIEESKKREVFLFEYEVENNPLHLRNGRILHIQQAWAEKEWAYPLFSNETLILENIVDYHSPQYSICLLVKEEDLEDYSVPGNREWWIGEIGDDKRGFNRSGTGLLGNGHPFKEMPSGTEVFVIYRGGAFPKGAVDTLGILTLKRK